MLDSRVETTNNQLNNITGRLNTNIDIGVITFLFVKSRIYFALFIFISFSLAFLYLRYSQPIYESKAVLQINNAQSGDILKLNNFENNSNDIAEAIEQIKSRVFLKRIVDKLDISVNYFSEGTFKSNELYHKSPYLIKINPKEGITYDQKIYVELNPEHTGGLLILGTKLIKFKVNEWLKTKEFDINVFINPKLDKTVIETIVSSNKSLYFTISEVNVVTSILQDKLDVRMINDLAKTILIKVTDANELKSADIINAITTEYLTYDVERKSESSRNILSFIDIQLGVVFNDLKTTEGDLQKFKQEKKFSEKDLLINAELLRYSSIEEKLLQVEMEEKLIAEIQSNIGKNKGVDIYQLISLISGTEYENIIKEITQTIQKLLIEKENLLYAVTPNSENIKQINYQLENQRKLLIESLEAVKLRYKTKYKNLLEKSSEFRSKIGQNPEDEVEFSRLSRLYSISEKYYTMLLEKKTEFSISKAGYVSKNIILEKALGAGSKVSPNKRQAFLIAFLVSLILSLFLVFVRYLFHDKIYSIKDITNYSNGNLSLLGIIPKYQSDIPISQLIVDKNPKALISEAFRAIRSNLTFLDNSDGPKIVSITSTISGEGKTFVAINIAGILAFTGKKVVIIDLDMRKPKIHKGFGVNNDVGMSTILTGKNEIDDCFNDSLLPNLKFITAGPSPPNPSELILSEKLKDVVAHLKTQFDFIVIDNAPIGLVTDGIETIKMANYPIYVFRAGYSKKIFTQTLDRLKNETKIHNLSVVLNDVDISKKIYSYNYGYGYGYGYGNGNGYYSDDEKFDKLP